MLPFQNKGEKELEMSEICTTYKTIQEQVKYS